jgi:hypothetical protein
MPTLLQLAPLIRILLPVIVGVASQYLGADAGQAIGSLIATLVGVSGWSLYANTQGSLAKTVASVQGLTVHVDRTADSSLQQLAADPTVKDIVPDPRSVPR